MAPQPGTTEWLGLVVEDVIDPERPIVDPHHHLWPSGGALPYGLAELREDVDDGHRIERTVMFECATSSPVDRFSMSYRTFWNAAKLIAAGCDADEQEALFRGTASRVYSL